MNLPQSIIDQLKKDLIKVAQAVVDYIASQRLKKAPRIDLPAKPNPTPIMPPKAVLNPSAPYDWSTPESSRHSLRVICDEEGLTVEQKNLMSQTLHCESGYNNATVHPNLNMHGLVTSTDYGICQINDHYHIGAGKDFPSVEYVHDNPEAVVRWMCKMVKARKLNLWVCYDAGLYKRYTP